MKVGRRSNLRRFVALTAIGMALLAADRCAAQLIPGLPSTSTPKDETKKSVPGGPMAAPTRDNPEATVATATGTIKTDKHIDDAGVEGTLEALLPKFPGVRNVDATVHKGIVELEGQVENAEIRDQMTRVAMQVEGVRMVINRLKTDAQVFTARQLVTGEIQSLWGVVSRRWLLALLALVVVLIFSTLARVFNRYSETLLAPFVTNMLLRSVLGSLIGSGLVIGGVMIALSTLQLTQAVLSIVGLAGVVGLAVGFAFRDIAENFIASILLGVRRPFRVGDYVTVAGHSGVVKMLNTRATVLVTLDGQHVRIPNAVIYKEILVNASASPNSRGTFDIMIPYDASTAAALDAVTKALRAVDGVLPDPPARALVEALETNGVRLRAYYWSPIEGVDGYKLNSDVRLKVKVALQQAGIMPPANSVLVSVIGTVPISNIDLLGATRNGHTKTPTTAEELVRPAAVVTPAQAEANLKRDSHAANIATAVPAAGRSTPIEHALSTSDTHVSEEGTNLLGNGK
jgi:small conductance mechanosensitive channel